LPSTSTERDAAAPKPSHNIENRTHQDLKLPTPLLIHLAQSLRSNTPSLRSGGLPAQEQKETTPHQKKADIQERTHAMLTL
jgi:hypothetical protein